jgi:hypothetical protein
MSEQRAKKGKKNQGPKEQRQRAKNKEHRADEQANGAKSKRRQCQLTNIRDKEQRAAARGLNITRCLKY